MTIRWDICLQRERAIKIFDEAQPESDHCGSSRNSVSDDDARHEDTLDSRRNKVPADKRNKLWDAADASYASDVIKRRSHVTS